jgi:hypothetical protein
MYQKRFYQLFNLLDGILKDREQAIEVITKLTQGYLKLQKSTSSTASEQEQAIKDMTDLVNLQYAFFAYVANKCGITGGAKSCMNEILSTELKDPDSLLK